MLNFAQIPIYTTGGFHPYYKLILLRASALGVAAPSIAWQIKQNALVVSLVRHGIWQHLDTFYNFYHDGAAGFSYINWITPSSFTASPVGTITFTALDGVKQSGGGDYIETNWSEATNGVNWQLYNCSFFVDIKESAQDNAYFCGGQDAASVRNTRIRTRNTSDVMGVRIDHPNNENTTANTDGSGLWHPKRTSSTAVAVYRNGSSFSSYSNTGATAVVTATHNILRVNTAGATVSTHTCRFYGTGDALTGFENQLYLDLTNYKS